MTTVRIATRGSRLAVWQAEHVARLLRNANADCAVELVKIVSSGDTDRDRPLHELGGVGVFTKEIEAALLAGTADVAVHSLKDLPTESHPDLVIAAIPERGPAGDVLLAPRYGTLDKLPNGARVATSSPRRRAQLLRQRPDLAIVPIRGNVETRVHKLHDEDLDGLILAAAGLDRLGLENEVTETLDFETMLPAPGQGALAVECRADNSPMRQWLACLDHLPSRQMTGAERALLRRLGAGCHAPVGALAEVFPAIGTRDEREEPCAGTPLNPPFAREGNRRLRLRGVVLDPAGTRVFAGERIGSPDDAIELGNELADRLLAQGAGAVIAAAGDGHWP